MNYEFSNIDEILKSLPPVHRNVIRWRYGIGMMRALPQSQRGASHSHETLGPNAHTLREIADHMGFETKERVRQIEEEALEKIRHPSRLPSFEALFKNDMYSTEIANLAKAVMGLHDFAKLEVASNDLSELRPVKAAGITLKLHPVRPNPQ